MSTRITLPALALVVLAFSAFGAQAAPATAKPAHATHRRVSAVTTVDSLDRMHARVAALRDAEQQRWIAQGLRSGRLSPELAAGLERDQARIEMAEARAERGGYETVNQALHIQHLQDVQDWAIRTGHLADGTRA